MGYTHVKDRVSKPMSGGVATLYSLRVRQSFLQLQDTGFQYSTHFRGEYPTTKLPALEPGSGFDVCIAQAGNAGLSAFNMGAVAILGTYVDRVLSEQNRDENSDYEFEVGSHESEVVYVDAAQEGNWTRFLNLPSNEDKANVVAMSNATEISQCIMRARGRSIDKARLAGATAAKRTRCRGQGGREWICSAVCRRFVEDRQGFQ